MSNKLLLATAACMAVIGSWTLADAASVQLDYRVLATTRMSTMEKELNEAAGKGYRFSKVMGGKTAAGGQEVAIAVVKYAAAVESVVPVYKLLATTRTSTMQKELQEWANKGYEYLDQTVFQIVFGDQVVVILELDPARTGAPSRYRLLATSKTSTMERELREAGEDGFMLLGFTVGRTEFGGEEIVSILRKAFRRNEAN